MSDSTRDLLTFGVAAAKANSKDEARYFLEWLLRDETAERDEHLEAWRWLARLSDDPKQKRDHLEQILARNPMDPEARRELLILNGDLNAADIVNPDQMPAPEPPKPITARRFVCSNCGGRMVFDAEQSALECKYCGNHPSLLDAMRNGEMIEEHNFIAALATSKGHSTPVASPVINCKGCAATFQFAPAMISRSCPYCDTPYVLEQTETRDLIAPAGIVPFTVDRAQAQRVVLDWYRQEGFKILSADALPSGIYLPAWTFDIGGVIEWSCLVESNDHWLSHSGSNLADENDLLVAASHTLRAALTQEIDHFPLRRLVPYDARYLADWAAETYTIGVGDASLVARVRVLAQSQPRIRASILQKYEYLQFNTLKLVVESYKLVLLPLWIARYRLEDKWYHVVINGQSGSVRGEKPRRGIRGWLAGMMDK